MTIQRTSGILAAFALATCLTGCNGGASTEEQDNFASIRSMVLDAAMPAKASSLEQLLEQDGLGEVTLVGRIYGGKLEPFDRENASFTITILPDLGHSHDDPGDCPFCKRRAENAPFAVVEIRDDSGNLIKTPADKLLDLAKNQDVVVRGTATKLDEMIVISADKITKVADLETAHGLIEKEG